MYICVYAYVYLCVLEMTTVRTLGLCSYLYKQMSLAVVVRRVWAYDTPVGLSQCEPLWHSVCVCVCVYSGVYILVYDECGSIDVSTLFRKDFSGHFHTCFSRISQQKGLEIFFLLLK